MNTHLEKTFNLDSFSADDIPDLQMELADSKTIEARVRELATVSETMDEAATVHETEMDDLYDDAHRAFKDIFDYGMSSDPKHAANIFGAAAMMLKLAVNTKNAKIDRRIRAIETKLKERKLDLDEKRSAPDTSTPTTGVVMSREDLIKMMRAD